jgi:hypothetical protein
MHEPNIIHMLIYGIQLARACATLGFRYISRHAHAACMLSLRYFLLKFCFGTHTQCLRLLVHTVIFGTAHADMFALTVH